MEGKPTASATPTPTTATSDAAAAAARTGNQTMPEHVTARVHDEGARLAFQHFSWRPNGHPSNNRDAANNHHDDASGRRCLSVLEERLALCHETDSNSLQLCGENKICIRNSQLVEWFLKDVLEAKRRLGGNPTLEGVLLQNDFCKESTSEDGLDCWVYKGKGRFALPPPLPADSCEHVVPAPAPLASPAPSAAIQCSVDKRPRVTANPSPSTTSSLASASSSAASMPPPQAPPVPAPFQLPSSSASILPRQDDLVPQQLQHAVLHVGIPGLPAVALPMDVVDRLLPFLLRPTTTRLVLLSASEGMGKTCLASKLVRNVDVRATYPDGMAWLNMSGRRRRRGNFSRGPSEADFMQQVLLPKYREMTVQLRLSLGTGLELPHDLNATLFPASHSPDARLAPRWTPMTPLQLHLAMSEALRNKRVLIVLDDIDSLDHLRWFLFEGVPVLATSRTDGRQSRIPNSFFPGVSSSGMSSRSTVKMTTLSLPRPSPQDCVNYFLQVSGRQQTADDASNQDNLYLQQVVELCSRVPAALEKSASLVSVQQNPNPMSMETLATQLSPQMEDYSHETQTNSPEAQLSACRRVAEQGAVSAALAVVYEGPPVRPFPMVERDRGAVLLSKRPYDEFMRQHSPSPPPPPSW